MRPSDGMAEGIDPRQGDGEAVLGRGARTTWRVDEELPVAGSVELPVSVGQLWQVFERVRDWPAWNPCMWTATVSGGSSLAAGTTPEEGELLIWAFNPIRRRYLYRLPAVAVLVEVVPERRMTWEVRSLPGMWARHTYWMEPIGDARCRFGSWEVAEGPVYRLLRAFWLAHFRYVCEASLLGAHRLADRLSAASHEAC